MPETHHTARPSACLYVVATPVGNLGDMVPRAVEILQSVDCILAEDTRHSKKLLQHFGITSPVQAFHDHSAEGEVAVWVKRLQQGESLALISDAGTPLVSDPGYPLVRAAHQADLPVVPIPGACAAIAALAASGLPADRFCFEGFLPAKTHGRKQRLEQVQKSRATVIFYEAPHRILGLLADMEAVLGAERECCVARELSKQYETIRMGSIADIKCFIESDTNQQRGEFVVLLAPDTASVASEIDADSEKVLAILLDELSVKQASLLAAKITGRPKRALYDLAVSKKNN